MLQVTLNPPGAVSAGAQWQVDGGLWQTNGATVSGLAAGNHTVAFNTVSGWNSPASQSVVVYNNSTTITNATYAPQPGSLQVTMTPAGAVRDGALWQVDSGAWQTNGATVSGLTVGNHTVAFGTAAGWTAPGNQTVAINGAQMTTTNGIYVVIPDAIKPTNQITLPTAGLLVSNVSYTVKGTATDNVHVAYVMYQLNGIGWNPALTGNSWTNWTAPVTLLPQTNVIQAYAADSFGNVSATNSVSCVCILNTPLSVGTNGLGTVSPNYNGTLLQVGAAYSMTATVTAGKGFAFANWTGGTSVPLAVLTNGATLKFLMQSNLMLQANFADTNRPTLSLTNLTAGQRWSNLVFTAKGTATDNWQVASVQVQLNGGVWTNATGTTNWSDPLTLTPGTNTVAAFATDATGNNSPTNSVSFQYVATNLLAVRATGLGTISPNYSNSWLEIGRNYSMTATPATGFVVTNWTISTNWLGGQITNNATVQFMMASNLTLQINFADVTKPTLTVTTPTANQKMTNALAKLVGTASDNWKVAGVWYQLNSNSWNLATTSNNFANWTNTVTLLAGTNALKFYALDLGGNFSATNSFSIVSSNTFMLQLAFTNALPLKTNGLVFSLQLSKGLNGQIQVSTNLLSWDTLTNFVGTNTTLNFLDPAATNSNRRFYRAVIP